jgi:alpha-galactosidase
MKTHDRASLDNQRAMFDRMLEGSDGNMVFDLDVTAEIRPGYFGLPDIGPLFVENRYTDFHRYWPHKTLRNLWELSLVVDPVRLRMELLNNTRN